MRHVVLVAGWLLNVLPIRIEFADNDAMTGLAAAQKSWKGHVMWLGAKTASKRPLRATELSCCISAVSHHARAQ